MMFWQWTLTSCSLEQDCFKCAIFFGSLQVCGITKVMRCFYDLVICLHPIYCEVVESDATGGLVIRQVDGRIDFYHRILPK